VQRGGSFFTLFAQQRGSTSEAFPIAIGTE
jgi:hypothetical protein